MPRAALPAAPSRAMPEFAQSDEARASWWPPSLWTYRGGAGRWQLLGTWQCLTDMQAARCAVWAAVHIELGHPGHEGFDRLGDPRVDGWHLKCRRAAPSLTALQLEASTP